jgi:hypothetical protein
MMVNGAELNGNQFLHIAQGSGDGAFIGAAILPLRAKPHTAEMYKGQNTCSHRKNALEKGKRKACRDAQSDTTQSW